MLTPVHYVLNETGKCPNKDVLSRIEKIEIKSGRRQEDKVIHVPDWISQCPNLKILRKPEYYGRMILTLPRVLPQNLTEITINYCNGITSLPFLPSTLKKLELKNVSVEEITNIPRRLVNLHITSCKIKALPKLPSTLTSLYLSANYLSELPKLSHCTITILEVQQNKISQLLPENFPQGLTKLDISNNKLTDLSVIKFPSTITSLNVSFNNFANKDLSNVILPPNLQTLVIMHNKISSLPQTLPTTLTSLDIVANNIVFLPLEIINCARLDRFSSWSNPIEQHQHPTVQRYLERFNVRERDYGRGVKANVYNDTQSVHNNAIQDCVRKSIMNIMRTADLNERRTFRIEEVLNDPILTSNTKASLVQYMSDKEKHSSLYTSFEEIFIDIWFRIKKHPSGDEIKKVLNTEMNDAACKCFTGRLSRLVNCLNAFCEDVVITVPDSEQISGIIISIQKRLERTHKYTEEAHREEAKKELQERGFDETTITAWIEHI